MQGKSGMDMYKEFEADRDQGNFDKLPELHAVLSGMKVSLSIRLTPTHRTPCRSVRCKSDGGLRHAIYETIHGHKALVHPFLLEVPRCKIIAHCGDPKPRIKHVVPRDVLAS